MDVKKFAAVFTAAAVLTVAAPMTGVLPNTLSVSVGAESSAQYKAGDVFYAAFDGEKWVTDTDEFGDEVMAVSGLGVCWVCTVLPDNTISVHYICPMIRLRPTTVPSQIAGYTVTAIDAGAGWSGTVTLPDTVTTIGESAFAYSDDLVEVKFGPNSQLKLIDRWAFENCRSLKTITIPTSVETIAFGAFLNVNNDSFNSDKYSLESVIFADGSNLKTIGDYAFQSQEALKSITLPDSLDTIGKGAFFSCRSLKSINIPDAVTTISEDAFLNNDELEEVEFGANSQLKLIDKYAFQNCRSLKTITIPASVETIAYGAFLNGNDDKFNSDEYSLESVIFADGSNLKTIGDYAFQYQEALKSITLPDSLNNIGKGAFYGCFNLTEITIPANVSEIGSYPVAGLEGETGKTMNISNIYVDPNNQSFKSKDGVLFSKDSKTIVEYPAAKNDSKYEIPPSVNNIAEGAFAGCAELTAVTIPEGVTEIQKGAFTSCTSLSEVKLPSTLKTIGKFGFEATKLTSIDIPESVTSIDKQAFENSALKNINGVAGSYAETYAKENGYTFNNVSSDNPNASDTNTLTDNSDNKVDDTTGTTATSATVTTAGTIVTTDATATTMTTDTTEITAATGSTEGTKNDKNVSTGVALSAVPVLLSACALAVSRNKKK